MNMIVFSFYYNELHLLIVYFSCFRGKPMDSINTFIKENYSHQPDAGSVFLQFCIFYALTEVKPDVIDNATLSKIYEF